jgi:hypothetical protein
MQPDGNFVVYDAKNTPTWLSGTNKGAGKYATVLQGTKFSVLKNNAIVWASNVPKPPVKPASAIKSPVKPGAKPVAKPGAKPGAKPAVKHAVKPGAKPGAKPAVKHVVKPGAKPGAKHAAKSHGVSPVKGVHSAGVRGKDTCTCNVNVSPSQTCNAAGQCPMCNKQVASPRSALKTLQQKAWQLSSNPSTVVPARSDSGSIGIRLQTLADQVASLSTEYNGLPEGGLAPIGFESFINF